MYNKINKYKIIIIIIFITNKFNNHIRVYKNI